MKTTQTTNYKNAFLKYMLAFWLVFSLFSISDLFAKPVCPIPTWPMATSITCNGALITWDGVSGATSYQLNYRVAGSSGTWNTINTSNVYYSLTGLSNFTQYEWQVRTNCYGSDISGFTNLQYFTTNNCYSTCNAPTGLSESGISHNSVQLYWNAVAGAISYTVEYQVWGSGAWTTTSNVYSPSILLSGLQASTMYEWRVRVNCSGGSYSSWSAFDSFQTTSYYVSCTAPSALNNNAISTSSNTISWSYVPGAIGYELQYRQWPGAWTTVTTGTNNYTLTGLLCGSNYEFCVRAICSSGVYSGWSYAYNFQQSCTFYCGAPAGVFVNTISSNQGTLGWNAVPGASYYQVQYRLGTYGTWISASAVNNNYTLFGLAACTQYQVCVRSYCSGSSTWSSWSPVFTFSTNCLSCDAPTNLGESNISSNNATVFWNSSGVGALSYTLQYRTAGSFGWTTINNIYSLQYNLNGLLANSEYEYQVRANCSSGNVSPWSGIGSFWTTPVNCGVPTGISSFSVTTNSAIINWVGVPGAVDYAIQYRAINSGSWITINNVNNQFSLQGLSPNTTYQICIRANCHYGSYGNWSSIYTFSTLAPYYCYTPSNLGVVSSSGNTAVLNWSAIPGAFGYEVQYRPVSGGSWISTVVYTNSLSLTALNSCSSYHFCVRTLCNPYGVSGWSYNFNFSTTCPPVQCQIPPSGLTAFSNSSNSATLNWQTVSGAVGYEIQYRASNSSVWQYASSLGNSLNINGLSPCTTYHYCVRAICASGIYSGWSYNFSFTTYCPPPPTCTSVPSNLSVNSISGSSSILSWTGVSGVQYYEVQYRNGSGSWITVNAYSNSITLTGLQSCATYHFCVRAVCTSGIYSAWSYNFIWNTSCQPTSCNTAPVGLSASAISAGSTLLSWANISGATAYEIQYRSSSASVWTTITTNSNSVQIYGLNACSTYHFCVRAICGYGVYSAWSTNYSWNTDCPPSQCTIAPTGLTSTGSTTGSLALSWNSVQGALSYQIQYRSSSSSTWLFTTSNTNSLNLVGLNACSNYYICIRAVCYSGIYSPWTPTNVFSTGCQPPACNTAPANISSINITNTSTNIQWGALNGVLYYEIQYRPSSSSVWQYLTTNTNSITLSSLLNCTQYHFCIRAVCSSGNGPWSALYNFTTTCTSSYVCSSPTNLSEWDIWNNSVRLMWTGIVDASTYTINYRAVGTSTWNSITSVGLGNVLDIYGLSAGTTYEWRIASNCHVGNTSGFSNVRTFTTLGGIVSTSGSNDNSCGAIALPVNFSCNYVNASNIGATGSSYPAAPSSCYYTGNDVWFRATIPSSGALNVQTLAGSLSDAVMAVYTGPDCNNLTYVMCIDDSYGTMMPMMSLTGTPGTIVWMRIWGYNNTSGNFSICATTNNLLTINPNIDQPQGAISPIKTQANGTENIDIIKQLPTINSSMKKSIETELFPNPAFDRLFIRLVSVDDSKLKVFLTDISGKEIKSLMFNAFKGENNFEINVSDLNAGVYFVGIVNSNSMISPMKKLIIQR